MVDKNTVFGGMLTALGAAKKTNCDALGIAWEPRFMLIGDAGGGEPAPDPSQTKLINQVYRAQLNQLYVSPADDKVLIAELVLPPDIGGWWIRELALEDKDGVFSAVASTAPSYKPLLTQGSGRNQVVRMHIITSGTANIQLKIDPSVVLATRDYVDRLTMRASQEEAQTGIENSKIMTPLRVFQAIAKVVGQATESVLGWAKVATQAQVATGSDDTVFLTPKKLRAAQATKGDAEQGTDDTKIMTPLRVFQAAAQTKRMAMISANGSWVCPPGVIEILVDASAGGAGGSGANGTTNAGQGGGGGGCIRNAYYAVSPGQVYVAIIGKGGAGGALNGDGSNGGVTSLGALFSLAGGGAGSKNGSGFGAAGGWGAQPGGDAFALGGAGGSTLFGVGGKSRLSSGVPGTGAGAGGSGGAPGYPGAPGSDGFILIRW
ncbi:phage tail protein [Pseudomonas sp. TWP3-1]|uniref:phage tail protein n=1 Tax=Pseudomonas sp. TWP3-1 TaxID=2804631 RepID=UPI003CECD96C